MCFRHSQAQAVVVVVGKLRGNALAAAAAAAAVRGIRAAAVVATHQAHCQVKATMAVLALDWDRVHHKMKAAVVVERPQLVQMLLIM